jgi:hypothetical protein
MPPLPGMDTWTHPLATSRPVRFERGTPPPRRDLLPTLLWGAPWVLGFMAGGTCLATLGGLWAVVAAVLVLGLALFAHVVLLPSAEPHSTVRQRVSSAQVSLNLASSSRCFPVRS